MSDFDKIRWRSRRGLLELDIILERFLISEWNGLTKEEQDIYVEILEELDNDLLDLINERKENTNPRWDSMVAKLRAA
ncbi:succinate dehydrogenase assembly factor 2 [Leeia sp. TBRC 13508]|uniref:FAD assembly factor SdhE n=1 Tax=Leeia speluncae TaxID=2884804 RepID=A0ABS8DAV6_9NEIS|nr:succinate dehydrogenase assembly factor 2 [Leeia speluncae]MCB6184743.1 succinate dehydrogenase assembly factor 2 [Leeia speluncae]